MSKKKPMKKTTKIKIAISSLIYTSQLFITPIILQVPEGIKNGLDITTILETTISNGFFNNLSLMFSETFIKPFGAFQLLTLAGITYLTMLNHFSDPNKRDENNDEVPEVYGNNQHGSARWLTDKEKDKVFYSWTSDEKPKKAGLILGAVKEGNKYRYWSNISDHHEIILGATRSGKGKKIILPSIYEMGKTGESIVFGDPKGELFETTSDYLKEQGYDIIKIDLRNPRKGNQWNPLDAVIQAFDNNDIALATERAYDIAQNLSQSDSKTEAIWRNGELSVLSGLILAVCLEADRTSQKNMKSVYQTLAVCGAEDEDEDCELNRYLEALAPDHPARSAFATSMLSGNKTRQSFFSQTLSTLRLFADPNIADFTAKQDHDFADVGRKPTAVYLVIPDEKSTRNSLATLYISQLYQALIEEANVYGGRLRNRVNFILDEFGNLPKINGFEQMVTVGASRGIRYFIFLQDFKQLEAKYEKNGESVIKGNCFNMVYLRSESLETLKEISEKLGKFTTKGDGSSYSHAKSIAEKGGFSESTSLMARDLQTPDEVKRWNTNFNMVITMGEFPAKFPNLNLWDIPYINNGYGFINTGNEDVDKEQANQVQKERSDRIIPRQLKEIDYWMPKVDSVSGVNEINFLKNKPRKKDIKNPNDLLINSRKKDSKNPFDDMDFDDTPINLLDDDE